MKKRDVIIVGGGASGLVSAISAAREGANVTLIEQKDQLGKKILSTGNGRCNLTNEYMDIKCFRGDDTSIVPDVLEQFGYSETIAFFEELGVLLKERQGYIYPVSDQSSTILDVLCMEIERLHVKVLLSQTVQKLLRDKDRFIIHTNQATITGDAVILATGGKAAPILGSDGSGYALAKAFGHHLSQVVPALVQLKGKGNFYKQISGVRTQAKASLYVDNEYIVEDTGELQLTNYGISGIPVFQISRYAAKALFDNKLVKVEVDFMPTMSDETFRIFLQERLENHGHKEAQHFLVGVFHKKLIGLLLKASAIDHNNLMKEVPQEKLDKLVSVCKHFKIEIQDTNDFEQAQVCAGGVYTTEIDSKTMESIYTDGLYLTGELLDIDGICGGYNLQWAWSTGYIAGKHAAKGK